MVSIKKIINKISGNFYTYYFIDIILDNVEEEQNFLQKFLHSFIPFGLSLSALFLKIRAS